MRVSVERSAKQPAKKAEVLSTTAAPQYQHSDGDATGEAVEHHSERGLEGDIQRLTNRQC